MDAVRKTLGRKRGDRRLNGVELLTNGGPAVDDEEDVTVGVAAGGRRGRVTPRFPGSQQRLQLQRPSAGSARRRACPPPTRRAAASTATTMLRRRSPGSRTGHRADRLSRPIPRAASAAPSTCPTVGHRRLRHSLRRRQVERRGSRDAARTGNRRARSARSAGRMPRRAAAGIRASANPSAEAATPDERAIRGPRADQGPHRALFGTRRVMLHGVSSTADTMRPIGAAVYTRGADIAAGALARVRALT